MSRGVDVGRRLQGWGGRLGTTTRGALVVLGVASAACQPVPPPPVSDPELRAELGIPDEVAIHRVDLSGRADFTRVIPRVTDVNPGDAIQFVVLDHRVHLIRFQEDRLAPEQLTFLRETGQDRLPPLVEREARLVLTFEGAPLGAYVFQVEGNGPPVDAVVRVTPAR